MPPTSFFIDANFMKSRMRLAITFSVLYGAVISMVLRLNRRQPVGYQGIMVQERYGNVISRYGRGT